MVREGEKEMRKYMIEHKIRNPKTGRFRKVKKKI